MAVLALIRTGSGWRDVQQGCDPLQDEAKDREPSRTAARLPPGVQEGRGTCSASDYLQDLSP